MAYPITSDTLNLFKQNYRQVATIYVQGVDDQLTLSEQDILSGGLSINRYSSSGENVALGTAIAAEAAVQLENADGRFDDFQFEGAELNIRVGVKDWNVAASNPAFIPFGFFTVDEVVKKRGSLTLKALDRMVLFDKPVDAAILSFPMTVETLLHRVCDICNVTLSPNIVNLANLNYIIREAPNMENLTYRQLLIWVAEITGSCAFMDWNGHLMLKWYTLYDYTITPQDRFSSDIDENEIEITGVRVADGTAEAIAGTDEYALNVENNPLIQHDHDVVAETLFYDVVQGDSFTPFTATVKPMPQILPLDMIKFQDDQGEHYVFVTDVTFTMNRNMTLAGKGESAKRRGYAAMNPLTAREQAIIEAVTEEQNKAQNDRIQTALAFNELICNALGLFITPVAQENGSVVYYLHNREALEESETIFTMTAQGIAWTSGGWNDGAPVWSYGVTAAGDALFRLLSAEGIEVSKVGEDYNIEITPSAFRIYYRDMLVTNIEADEMEIPRVTVSTYLQCGKIRLVPFGDSGANIIFVD